jgi:hypothetical protein
MMVSTRNLQRLGDGMRNDRMNVLDEEIEAELANDDGSTTRAALASGRILHITREDTPPGHVIRVYPDGREETVHVDRDALAAVLG